MGEQKFLEYVADVANKLEEKIYCQRKVGDPSELTVILTNLNMTCCYTNNYMLQAYLQHAEPELTALFILQDIKDKIMREKLYKNYFS